MSTRYDGTLLAKELQRHGGWWKGDKMTCPECKEDIAYVYVYSQRRIPGTLDGNEIVDYESIDEVTETTKIECPECKADLRSEVVW